MTNEYNENYDHAASYYDYDDNNHDDNDDDDDDDDDDADKDDDDDDADINQTKYVQFPPMENGGEEELSGAKKRKPLKTTKLQVLELILMFEL